MSDGMSYEKTPIKGASKGTAKRSAIKVADQLGTSTLLWLVIKRHKVGLLATWAISVTVIQMFPFVPALVVSFFTGI